MDGVQKDLGQVVSGMSMPTGRDTGANWEPAAQAVLLPGKACAAPCRPWVNKGLSVWRAG